MENTAKMSPTATPIRLTATTVRALTCPPDKSERTYFDEDLPGFGCRVRASGAQTWLYQYAIAKQTKKIFLGSPSVVDAGKARAAAKDLAAQVRLGRDPVSAKAMSRVQVQETVGALLPRFLERARARLKPRSFIETERHLMKHGRPLHALPVSAVDRRAIAKLLSAIAETSGPSASNRVRASLSGYFTWLIKSGFIETHPVSFTDKATEGDARSRLLSDRELAAIWRTLDDGRDYDAILKLLLLTGARRDEIGSLCWSEIDLAAATITLPPARTKSRHEHIVPLSPPALAILEARRQKAGGERDLVFSGQKGRRFRSWSVAKAALDARLAVAGDPVTGWTLHDFRRSLSTSLHERFNVLPHIVETVLGHIGGHKAGVARVYNKALYLDERRRALGRWADHILALASSEPATAQIVKLR
jgi:integrase